MNNVFSYPYLYFKRRKKKREGISFKTVPTNGSSVQPYSLLTLPLASKCWAKVAFCWLVSKKTKFPPSKDISLNTLAAAT